MIRILFCDNDAAMLKTMGRYLSWYGIQVDGIENPNEVTKILEKSYYDLLICNARMEPLDGFVLCANIRNSPKATLRDLPILIVVPENPAYQEFQFLRREKIYFLMKYQSPEKWHEKIGAILHNQRLKLAIKE